MILWQKVYEKEVKHGLTILIPQRLMESGRK